MTNSPLEFPCHWYVEGFESCCLRHHLGANVSNGNIFFQIRKRKFESCKKGWIHFGSVSHKQLKAYLSSLLIQKHICVEVFCFTFFTVRLIFKPSDFMTFFQYDSFSLSSLHPFTHLIKSVPTY